MSRPITTKRGWTMLVAAGIGIALLITLFSPFASSDPDGLEKVAEDKAFIQEAEDPSFSIVPDYTLPGVESERLATILSGMLGVVIVAAVGLGVGYGLKMLARSRTDSPTVGSPGEQRSPAGPSRG